MATLYFNAQTEGGSNDGDWSNSANWWQDEASTIPNNALPSTTDSVVILSTVAWASGGDPTVVNCTTLFGNLDGPFTLTVTGTATINGGWLTSTINGTVIFNSGSNNQGIITGNCTFNDNSYNSSTITGNCTFNNTSYNNGPITGNVTFNNEATNASIVTGNIEYTASSFSGIYPGGFPNGYATGTMTFSSATPVTFTLNTGEYWGHYISSFTFTNPNPVWIFNGDSYVSTGATIGGTAIFNDTSYNNSTIDSSCTFNDSSYNDGSITGDCTFNDTSTNGLGHINGNVIFNDFSTHGGGSVEIGAFTITMNDYSSITNGMGHYYTVILNDYATSSGNSYAFEFVLNDNSSGNFIGNYIDINGNPIGNCYLDAVSYSFNGQGAVQLTITRRSGINGSSILGLI